MEAPPTPSTSTAPAPMPDAPSTSTSTLKASKPPSKLNPRSAAFTFLQYDQVQQQPCAGAGFAAPNNYPPPPPPYPYRHQQPPYHPNHHVYMENGYVGGGGGGAWSPPMNPYYSPPLMPPMTRPPLPSIHQSFSLYDTSSPPYGSTTISASYPPRGIAFYPQCGPPSLVSISKRRRARLSRPPPQDAPTLSCAPGLRLPPGFSLPSIVNTTMNGKVDAPPPPASPSHTTPDPTPTTPTFSVPNPLSSKHLPPSHLLPKGEIDAISTTATMASSSAPSSPILTPASPTTTITTLDSAIPSSSSSPSDATPAPTASSPAPSSPSPASEPPTPTPAPTTAPPKKSWADLVRSPTSSATAIPSAVHPLFPRSISGSASTLPSIPLLDPGQSLTKTLSSLPLTLPSPTIIPRGLINNGNLCFANAILQLLVHTGPFWQLLDLLKRETKVGNGMKGGRMGSLDAMVVFIEEFRASTLPTLVRHSRQKSATATPTPPPFADFPAPHPDPFVPEQVYESLKPNKRFDAMRRGHQEDAEEFLGFFLDTIHEEILGVLHELEKKEKANGGDAEVNHVNGNGITEGAEGAESAEWLEVGSKGKTATTRTTETRESPITAIFGGHVRSVLRCPGQKDSITLEPYQRLQLDIQPDSVRSVEDALRNLTLPETLPDYNVRPGHRADATKQVFLESFPPVLILHLKRFLYDNVGGVQKSGKIIGYGTELEIAQELIAPSKRDGKRVAYELYGVVLHHGAAATGGHYTVSVRQQSTSSWIHIDDTHIRPMTSAEVAVPTPPKSASPNNYEGACAYLLCYRLVGSSASS